MQANVIAKQPFSGLNHSVPLPPAGAAIGAFVGGVYGAETCLVVAAFAFFIQAVVILTSPVPRLARQPQLVG